MPFAKDSLSTNAFGGTELMKYALEKRLDPELLDKFQIFVSRVEEPLSEEHVRIYWLQDLAGDPASEHLHNSGWEKFHRLVFSSHWQMRGYIERYNIPWSKCIVLPNCIVPIDFSMEDKSRETIRLIYHTTPHRGLQLLVPVFQKLREDYKDITLDVYSSFKVYGWEQRDEPFQKLFEECKNSEGIHYHGSVSNDEIKEILKTKHIYAYPSIWQETSCISLMEAMSAGLVCVHPNLGALFETSANWTHMYQFNENMQQHANMFYSVLRSAIDEIKFLSDEQYKNKIMTQKAYADIFYNWTTREAQWDALLRSLINEPKELPKASFIYRTT